MFHGSVRAKAKSSTPIRIKICAHGQHFLCAVQTSDVYGGLKGVNECNNIK